jgi:hypothetical protein
MELRKGKPILDLEKLHAQGQNVQDTAEEDLGAFECERGDVDLQWNNMKRSVVDATSDLLVEVHSGGQESCGLHKKCSVKWMNEVEGCLNTTKKRKNDRRAVNFCQSTRRHSMSLFKLFLFIKFFS